MRIYEPESLKEASAFLADKPGEARIIAGGTALTLMIKHGFTDIPILVDIVKVKEAGLREIRLSDSEITIGCLTTLDAIANSATVRQYLPGFAKACQAVGNPRIRNVATIGGCLAEADYASDPPAALISLDASCVLRNGNKQRTIAVNHLITGYLETEIQDGELLESVSIPRLSESAVSSYERRAGRSAGDRPSLGIASLIDVRDGRLSELRVVAGAATYRPFYPHDLCHAFRSEPSNSGTIERFAAEFAAAMDPISDIRASAEYRARLAEVTVQRQLTAAITLATQISR